jgi:hypothetical protein
MNGFIARTMTVACLVAGAAVTGGCCCYRDIVDPCYPERYEYAARQEVYQSMAPQVHNGHILDQTMWNWHFEYDDVRKVGTDRLNPAGMEHLTYLIRRRPCPDPVIYLATAEDITYDPAGPDRFAEARADLDNRRIQAIQKYLAAQTAGRHMNFQVLVHDPADPGIAAEPAARTVRTWYSSFSGVLRIIGAGGVAGAAGGGGGGVTVSGGVGGSQ